MAEGHNLVKWVRQPSWRWVMGKESSDVFTITEAQRGLSVEQTGRTRRYLISMGIRTACVILAILVGSQKRRRKRRRGGCGNYGAAFETRMERSS
jgi:hypothetical protein